MKNQMLIACLAIVVGIGVKAAETPREALKIMSFNICHCEGMDGRIDIARTAARIRAEDPDFACLQEVDWRTARVSGVDEPAELARLTGLHDTFAKAIFYRGGQYGVMILSREKPLAVKRIPLPGHEPRLLLLAEFDDCFVGSMHLALEKENREKAVEIVRTAVKAAAATKPVFLCGDWNAQPDSAVLKGIGTFMKVISTQKTNTFHGGKRPLNAERKNVGCVIDYVAVDTAHAAQVEVLATAVTEDRETSDHAPVSVTLRLK